MTNITIKKLRPYTWPLVILLIACGISSVIIMLGLNAYSDAKQKTFEVLSLQDQLYRDIERLSSDKAFLERMGESFERIQALGFFAEEDRLSWAEVTKKTAQRLKLPGLKYSIAPQHYVYSLSDGSSSVLQLSQSVMMIEADLLHEGDFIVLSKQLSLAPGLFRILNCDLEKADEIALEQLRKNISLKCSLAWHTLTLSSAAEDSFDEELL